MVDQWVGTEYKEWVIKGPGICFSIDDIPEEMTERFAERELNIAYAQGRMSREVEIEEAYKKGIFHTEETHRHAIESYPKLVAEIESLKRELAALKEKP